MNLPKNKNLIIFDFDETLCTTNGTVKRYNHTTEITDLITPGEYSGWRASGDYDNNPSNWDLDFSDFMGFPENGIPIKDTISILRERISEDDCLIALVTGRDELEGPKQFLQSSYINTDQMILLCSGNPDKKPCFEGLISTLEPKTVTIYEDCVEYIVQCEEVCAKYKIPCAAILVTNGEIDWNWRFINGDIYE